MNEVSSFNSERPFPDFRTGGKILFEMERIGWAAKFSAALPSVRTGPLDKIKGIWTEVLKMATKGDLDNIKASIPKLFPPMMKSIYRLVEAEVKVAGSVEDIQRIANRIISSIPMVEVTPLVKTSRGMKGVTLLANYPNQSYVIKWTNRFEDPTNRIYSMFQGFFEASRIEHSFYYVPEVVGLDFDKGRHYLPSGQGLVLEEPAQMKSAFDQISSTCKQNPSENFITLTQMIHGENLFDFIDSKYQYLNPVQKKSFFKQWARLAMMDLLLANTDRYMPVLFDDDLRKYSLDGYESNLGNAMVVWSPDKKLPALYAIDNVIDPEMVDQPEMRKKYCSFLIRTFSHPQCFKILASQMELSVSSSLNCDDGDVTRDKKAQRECFLKEFSEYESTLAKGFAEMAGWLHQALIPQWERKNLAEMNDAHPNVMKAVQGQIGVFKCFSAFSPIRFPGMIVHEITESVDKGFESDDADRASQLKNLGEQFLNELSDCGNYFESGNARTEVWLAEKFIPQWESDQYKPLRDYLAAKKPDLMADIQPQIDALKSTQSPVDIDPSSSLAVVNQSNGSQL